MHYLSIRGAGFLYLGSVPLVVNELGGADVVPLGLIGAGEGRGGGELLAQTLHQLLEGGAVRHRAPVELALVGDLGDQDLNQVHLPVLVKSLLLLLLHVGLEGKYMSLLNYYNVRTEDSDLRRIAPHTYLWRACKYYSCINQIVHQIDNVGTSKMYNETE